MENYNNLNDKDLNRLLKHRLLELEDDALLEAEAKLVFSSTVVIAPDIKKEEAVLKKLTKTKGKFWKWLFKGTSILSGCVALVYVYQQSTRHTAREAGTEKRMLESETGKANRLQKEERVENANSYELSFKLSEQQLLALVSGEQKSTMGEKHDEMTTSLKLLHIGNNKGQSIASSKKENKDFSSHIIIRDSIVTLVNSPIGHGIYKGQLIAYPEKENGNCSSPIIIKDSIIVLVNLPVGAGKELKAPGKAPDNELYVEKKNRTVWYKFSVKKNCKLAFDITPINGVNDFDFKLFQYNGPNFSLQLRNKEIIPIRTCISGNDGGINDKTGLNYDEQAPVFVHSEQGPSYVKYVNAKKGQVFYLAVDCAAPRSSKEVIYDERRGYAIRFHYKEYDPDELYVGKSIFNKIYFVTDEDVFRSNSGYEAAIDSIYNFLKIHPKVKVEIQGHVNSAEFQREDGRKTHSQELSERRAKAVFDCLAQEGMDSLRMVPVGYAGTRKKIQNPKTIAESSINVRVDIVILSLDYEADQKLTGRRTDKK